MRAFTSLRESKLQIRTFQDAARTKEKKKKKEVRSGRSAQTRDAQSQRCGLRAREVKPLGKTLGMAAHFYAERRDREEEEEEEDASL